MRFSSDKSNVVLFHCKRAARQFAADPAPFTLSGFAMAFTGTYTYLGMVLSADLRWDHHFKALRAKLTRTVAFITRMIGSTILPLTVKALVNATVRAQISYGLPYWQPTSKQFAVLNSLLAAPLKRALSLPRSAHTLSVLAEFGIPAVEVMREHLLLRAAARAVNLVPAGSDAAVWSKQAAALTFFDTVVQHTKHSPLFPTLSSQAVNLLQSGNWLSHSQQTQQYQASLPANQQYTLNLQLLLDSPAAAADAADAAAADAADADASQAKPVTAAVKLSKQLPVRAARFLASRVSNPKRQSLCRRGPQPYSGAAWLLQHVHGITGSITTQRYLRCDSLAVAKLRARFRFHRTRTKHYYHAVLPSDLLPAGSTDLCDILRRT